MGTPCCVSSTAIGKQKLLRTVCTSQKWETIQMDENFVEGKKYWNKIHHSYGLAT